METNNKPDIIKFLCGELDYNGVWFGDAIAGKTFWWRSVLRDTIEERDAKIAEIEKENDQCKVYQRMNSLSNRKMVEDNAKLEDKVYKLESENQALKSELDKAKGQLSECLACYVPQRSPLRKEILAFLKDKR